MSTGQRFMVKLHGNYLQQDWLNVFWYEQTSGSAGANALAEAFNAEVPAAMAPMMVTACNMTLIEVINLDNEADFWSVTPNPTAGSDVGDGLPAYFATAFIYQRATRASRNGWKRFTGVSEPMVDGANLASAYQAEADGLASVLQTYVTAQSCDFHPKIGRVTYNEQGVPTYTLFPIAGVEFSKLSTQNSRKP